MTDAKSSILPDEIIKLLPLKPVEFISIMNFLGFNNKEARSLFQKALEHNEVIIDSEMRVSSI